MARPAKPVPRAQLARESDFYLETGDARRQFGALPGIEHICHRLKRSREKRTRAAKRARPAL